jgi:photosystem II stability/assembly factor-like uncharacterized protein
LKAIALIFLFIFSFSSSSYAQWEQRYPKLPEDKISDITFRSQSTGLFVNEAGAIYRTKDGGKNWAEVFYDGVSRFSSVQFIDDQIAFAYAFYGSCFTYTLDGGETWSQDDLNVHQALKVIGFSPSEFLKVDESGIYKTTSVFGKWDSLYKFPTAMIDGGDLMYEAPVTRHRQTWQLSDSSLVTWMYNWYKAEHEQESDSLNFLLYSEDRGNTWDSVWVDVAEKLQSLHMADAQTGYVLTEEKKFYKTTNGGSAWEQMSIPSSDQSPSKLTVISPERIYLHAGRDILKTKDGGENWETLKIPEAYGVGSYTISKYNLSAHYFLLLKVNEDSEEWVQGKQFQTVHGSKLHFKNENVGWAYKRGATRKTEDGGYTWEIDDSFPIDPLEIEYTDQITGWIFGNEDVYKTEDAGETWIEQDIFDSEEAFYDNHILFKGSFGILYGNVNCPDLSCGTLMVTSDAGDTWQEKNVPEYFESLSISAGKIFGVGDDKKLWVSNDKGDTWDVAYDYTNENLWVRPLVRSIQDMVWLNVGSGTLAYSKDGGQTWKTTSAEVDEDMSLIGPFSQGNYYLYVPVHGNVLQINSDLQVYDKRDQKLNTQVGIEDIEYILDEANEPHIWLKGTFNTILYRKGPLRVFVSNEEEAEELPLNTTLHQNYPNPFNPTTTFTFDLEKPGHVKLSVFNMSGQEVAVIQNNVLSAGTHSINFDASHLASGTYIYRLRTEKGEISKKLTLIK